MRFDWGCKRREEGSHGKIERKSMPHKRNWPYKDPALGMGLAHSAKGKEDSGAGCGGEGDGGVLQEEIGKVATVGDSGIYPKWDNSISYGMGL